jgi:hypothetical protein
MRLAGIQLEWVAQTSHYLDDDAAEVVEVLVEGRPDKCREPEDLLIRITVERCRCLNGGWCVNVGATSGNSIEENSEGQKSGCECPLGYSGTRILCYLKGTVSQKSSLN